MLKARRFETCFVIDFDINDNDSTSTDKIGTGQFQFRRRFEVVTRICSHCA